MSCRPRPNTPTPTNTPPSGATATPTSSGSDLIFADGFESGNFSAWSANVTNSGNLSVNSAAALAGGYGLRATISSTADMYVRDDSPNAEARYRARFYFDPNSISMSNGNYTYLLSGKTASNVTILLVQFNRSSTNYQLRARAYDSGLANYVNTSYVNITDAVHVVEVDWGNDGHLTFWIDGLQQAALTGINNSIYTMDSVRFGAPYISGTGISGSYYIDAFESRRSSYIGPLALAPSAGPALAMGGQFKTVAYHLPSQNNSLTLPDLPAVDPVFSSATFTYDGDGNRVSQTINGVTTYFIGNYYELTGAQVTKYYYAGAQRVAMRKYTIPQPMTVEYFLGDHLGSTSLTTDSNGSKVSEMRYTAWGEVRYSWTAGQSTTPAYSLPDYTYTGQFSNVNDFGLMFYNARWYDPYLNQLTQPDTIVSNLYDPQSLNRYSYVRNNPIRYNDPSGHKYCDGSGLGGECDQSDIPTSRGQLNRVLRSSGVKLKGNWKYDDAYAVYLGVTAVGEKLARTLGGSAESAFQKVFKNGVNFTWGGEGAGYGCTSVTSGGCTSGDSQINFWSMSNDMVKNVVHELGHAFYHAAGNPLLGNAFSRNALIRNESYAGGEVLVWEQHPISMNDPKEDIPTELFADTFIAWTYDTWNPDPRRSIALAVNNARNEMDRIASSIP